MKNYSVEIYAPNDLSAEWYVYIYDLSVRKIVKKFYKGLKRADNIADRLSTAKVLQKVVEEKLRDGWNPASTVLPQPYQRFLPIPEAYGKALEIIKDSDLELKTKQTYATHLKVFLSSVKKLGWITANYPDLDAFHFQQIIENIPTAKSPAGFNKHLSICKAYNYHLKRNFIIKENKASGIPAKKHTPKEKRLLSSDEQTAIINHFRIVMPTFNVYLKTLYHLSIRPKELRLLKCGMIDKKNWFFNLPAEITKNDKDSIIIIPPDLRSDLEKFDLSDNDFYLFGRDFLPSAKIQATNRANNIWKENVKDILNIDSDMYYLKSKSNNDKLRNGMSLDDVKEINRHSTSEITKIYATEQQIIRMQQNIDKFGSFS